MSILRVRLKTLSYPKQVRELITEFLYVVKVVKSHKRRSVEVLVASVDD